MREGGIRRKTVREPSKMPPVPVESVLNPEPLQTAPSPISSSNRDLSIIRDVIMDQGGTGKKLVYLIV